MSEKPANTESGHADAAAPGGAPSTPPARQRGPVRRPALLLAALVLVLAAAGAGAYWYFIGRNYEDTDDAYVNGRVIVVTPQTGGTVIAVGADETDTVAPGQMLVRLDPADAHVDLLQREAQLGQAVRETRNLYANNDVLQANIRLRQTELDRANDDLQRRMAVRATGVVSEEDIQHAEMAVATAKAALQSAREQLAANRTVTSGTPVASHPNVLAAAARLREAYLAVKRGEILAPVGGQIARRNVQVGQRVAPGTAMMSLVPMDNLWVDANFKEVQLAQIRIGQPARLVADVYGSQVQYTGRVIGLGAGTGAAFALLPAQNATGNWIKVVQRVPVRIALDPQQLREHPLRVGLSMRVTIDVRDHAGALVSTHDADAADDQTTVYDGIEHDADALIARIIASNNQSTAALADDGTAAPAGAELAKQAAR